MISISVIFSEEKEGSDVLRGQCIEVSKSERQYKTIPKQECHVTHKYNCSSFFYSTL